ncbi:HDIG domain-containing protein [Mariprofundus aestuarium]|uniref:HDIG domain-containing protein n=1 Tax=Mariprofundus aestuarium TaxID=1921086 RepID=A0A2K8KVI5_MARES|nr:HD domain-containing phosphohydrolase [Mariprofundus aestuarium]ATX78763.1 HDIG domain-containing protein [Mariprofundus aestuarium]
MTPEETDNLIGHLRLTLGKMEASLDSITEGLIWINEDDRIQWCDNAFARMLGQPPIQLLGKDLFDIMPLALKGASLERGEHPVSRVNKECRQAIGQYEYTNEHTRTFETSASYVDLQSAGFSKVVVFHDITQQKQAFGMLEESKSRLRSALRGTVQVVSKAVEARDPYTSGHQLRVSSLSRAIAQEMGWNDEQVEGVRLGAIVHDIGKIQVPAEILSKPTKLTTAEYELVRCHAEAGFEILKDVEFPWPVANIAYQHHERLDGSGYPQGLKGDEICPEAKIVAVADVVEAMSSHRPYRAGLGLEVALGEIAINRGRFYDLAAVDACLKIFKDGSYSLEGGLSVER